MAGNNMGLGKGLEALIKETATEHAPKDVHTLPIHSIRANPNQPRRIFSEKALTELANSINQQGLLQPILVRPLQENDEEGSAQEQQMYEIVAGERRFRASQKAGLVEIPVVVRPYSDQESLTAALVENIQRENLNPMEEALAFHALREQYELSQEELAQNLGKSRSSVANSLRLLTLPLSIQEDVAKSLLSAGHARALLSIDDAKSQNELHARILEEALTVRECEGLASLWKENGTFSIPRAPLLAVQQNADTIAEIAHEDLNPAEDVPPAKASLLASTSLSPTDAGHTPPQALHPTNTQLPTTNVGQLPMETEQSFEGIPAQENPQTSPIQKPPSARKLPQSAFLVTAQERFSHVLKHPVKISGKEDKGKITIAYASAEELEALLQLIEPLTPQ